MKDLAIEAVCRNYSAHFTAYVQTTGDPQLEIPCNNITCKVRRSEDTGGCTLIAKQLQQPGKQIEHCKRKGK